jgi:biopolymer transport protein TolQ
MNNLAIYSLVSQAGLLVQLIMLLLVILSIVSWAIIFDKIFTYFFLDRKIASFEKRFWSGQNLFNFYDRIKSTNNNPLSRVFIVAVNEWKLNSNLKKGDIYAKERLKERVYQAMMVSRSKSIMKIEKNYNILAIIASASPFIGLFGTVWGIMNSFYSIAGSQNTGFSVVAPGIAEALLATAIGLLAAIPALIFYNLFVAKAETYRNKIEDFCIELMNFLSRELEK